MYAGVPTTSPLVIDDSTSSWLSPTGTSARCESRASPKSVTRATPLPSTSTLPGSASPRPRPAVVRRPRDALAGHRLFAARLADGGLRLVGRQKKGAPTVRPKGNVYPLRLT